MYQDLISIIVPIYNSEKYISSCIDSILKQKYTKFELILVNDGSTDNTENICKKYQAKDQRIKYFKKLNGGVSSARNYGLAKVSGNWLCFIDSDDVVTESYLNSLIDNIPNNNSLVFCNYEKEHKKIYNIGNTYVENKSMITYFIENLTMLSAPYAKLYNTDIIKKHQIKFPEDVHMGEDAIFILKYLNHVDGIQVSNSIIYTVKQRENSLSSKYNAFYSEWQGFLQWKSELETFMKKYGNIFENEKEVLWNSRIGETFYRCLQSIYKSQQKLNLKERTKLFKYIPEIYYSEYQKYYHPKYKLQKLNKMLICNKQYNLFYYLGRIYSHIKRK